MIVSATALSSYLYCPRKLFLDRVLKLVEPPKEVLVRGSIRHDTYDEINKSEEKLVRGITSKLELKDLTTLYLDFYSSILDSVVKSYSKKLSEFNLSSAEVYDQVLPYFESEGCVRSINLFNFIEKEGLLGDKLWENLMPKLNSEVKVQSEFLQLRGIIDQIEVWNNRMVPVELKTGKMPTDGVWPGHRIQLGCYALLLEELKNTHIMYGYVNYLDYEEKRIVMINPFLRAEVKDLIQKVRFLLTSKSIPKLCGSENKCKVCGLRDKCHDEDFIQEELGNLGF